MWEEVVDSFPGLASTQSLVWSIACSHPVQLAPRRKVRLLTCLSFALYLQIKRKLFKLLKYPQNKTERNSALISEN
jgi:hypothetical protein